ncbi:ASCH domain-containing protein [Limosilactobacillus sp. STM2_1]|uniref:ASCH domain-containing protein n=1 Tax=Limosilactobacillus rudii TaxID=2759755 RepID=A0A7W3UIY1_9LACO|nr:ASCH domain-containing protein [Limosilactobacillus rudii]MBB1080065.1 ASCH domain-containing protein [Limosilactobacillus rudii]MBB1096447.1 ASCH domain-containing protein [Limosilactobacillus rudii]MCD7133552.1 ASCH domain-containing protein [Limosilactobacillus rudii]
MKALSIRPEYAMEILNGVKTEEYRSWTTHYRGDLLICNSAKKTPGAVAGYALCVVKITDIVKRDDGDGPYYAWKIAAFEQGGSYWINPIKVKGQLKLFNVADSLIVPAPFTNPFSLDGRKWYQQKIAPLVY